MKDWENCSAELTSKYKNYELVMEYVDSILTGRKIACRELIQTCERFRKDLQNEAYDFRPHDAEVVIKMIERTMCHAQGEKLDGTPLRGTPFLLEPFHKFIVYNLLGFYHAGTGVRRFNEAFIYIPRKNIKTSFAAALAWSLSLLERKSGSKCYIVGAALKQALEGRLHILGKMLETLPQPRANLSQYAPKIIRFMINPEKIRDVIGPGGKMINKIIADCGGVKIDIEDDGRVYIATPDDAMAQKARRTIEGIAKDVEVGDVFTGKVARIMSFATSALKALSPFMASAIFHTNARMTKQGTQAAQ